MNEPRISRRERKLHLSYDLSSRIYCSATYPVLAPNGSQVIIYGHDSGLQVLWRGGKRRRERAGRPAPPKTNGASHEVITIDSDGDSPQQPEGTHDSEDTYEDIDDEEDSDCAYPPIIQELNIHHDSPVWNIAVPSINSAAASQLPEYAQTHIIIVQGSADSTVYVKAIPLDPPTDAGKDAHMIAIDEVCLRADINNPRNLALKVIPDQDYQQGCRLLAAAAGSSLALWEVAIGSQDQSFARQLVHQPGSASIVGFPFSRSHTQLLVSNRAGVVRVFDPKEIGNAHGRPTSKDSISGQPAGSESRGRWTMSYCAPYHSSGVNPNLARRKIILDAAWVLSGRAILVLLEDGEWGLWDMQSTAQAGKNFEDFALRGYLGTSSSTEPAETSKQKKGGARLAPMTPNTRRTKSENLFAGPEKVQGVAPSGGISVAPSSDRSGAVDESVVISYNNEIYSIPSIHNFWQRNLTSNERGFGSLYTPGLTHMNDINLMNENITSISRLASRSSSSALGQMNVPKDLLVSTESRFIIVQHLVSSTTKRGLFSQAADQPAMQDQRMLDVGELDLGGMDRMLDSMAGGGRTRRVEFAP